MAGYELYAACYDGKVYRFDPDGTLTSSYTTHSGYYNLDIVVDNDGFQYVATGNYSYIDKYNSGNTLAWGYDMGSGEQVYGVAVDGSGNVYGGDTGDDIVKLNSSGSLQWTYTAGDVVYCVAVDASGNVYGGTGGTDDEAFKLNSSGSLQWTYSCNGDVEGIDVDSSGNVYVAADNAYKLNSAGSLQWSYATGGSDVVADSTGIVYVAADATGVIKLDSAGSLQWTYDPGFAYSVTVDGDDFPYWGGNSEVGKISKAGSLLWTNTSPTDTVEGITTGLYITGQPYIIRGQGVGGMSTMGTGGF